MLFLDEVDLDVAAGTGGRGAVSFRREKYVPAGGPDGGDGGRGGDVVVIADSTDSTLSGYRDRRHYAAGEGKPGEKQKRTGHDGEAVILHVPPGTVLTEGGQLIADLDRVGASVVVALGGKGGRGNARFATSTRQAPRIGELGEGGERRRIHLELKLIADIGLVGLPNAGKSTLLAALTGAHPKIASYPFTTLHPNLGVVELPDGRVLVLADVPGLIEGASTGAGLGLDFLRHLERTRALIHVVDASAGEAAADAALGTVTAELAAFSTALGERPTVVALNKVDLPEGAAAADRLASLLPDALPIAAATGAGCQELLAAAARLVGEARAAEAVERAVADDVLAPAGSHRVYRHRPRATAPVVTREHDAYRVVGPAIERAVASTDLDSDEAVTRLQRRLAAAGVDAALAAAGAREGDTVRIGSEEFTYTDLGLSG